MKFEIVFFIVMTVLFSAFAVAKLQKLRYIVLVAEGSAALLYRKGKFVEQLGPGRHVRWGWHYAMERFDLRKGFLTIAGQEVLTSDNVGLKVSLLVNYQLADPVKAAHETQ